MQDTAAAYCSTLQLSSTRDIYTVYTFTPHTQLLLAATPHTQLLLSATGICIAAAACTNCNRHGTRGPWKNVSARLSARHLSRLGRSRRYATESTCPHFAHPGYVSLTLNMYLLLCIDMFRSLYISVSFYVSCTLNMYLSVFCTPCIHFAYSVFQDVC